jgi:ribonuclease HI
MNLQINLSCDGACSGNPGPGGFAYTLIAWNPNTNEALKTLHGNGYDRHTTNNRMESHLAGQ